MHRRRHQLRTVRGSSRSRWNRVSFPRRRRCWTATARRQHGISRAEAAARHARTRRRRGEEHLRATAGDPRTGPRRRRVRYAHTDARAGPGRKQGCSSECGCHAARRTKRDKPHKRRWNSMPVSHGLAPCTAAAMAASFPPSAPPLRSDYSGADGMQFRACIEPLLALSLSLSGHCTSAPQISLSDPSRAQGEAEGKRGGKGRERALHACTHVPSPRRRDCAPPWALERTPPKCRFACLDVVSCVPADSQHSLSPTTPSPPCIRRICRHPGCGLGAPQRACPKRRPREGGFRSRAHIGMGLHRSAAISRRRCVAVLECVCRCAPAMSAHLVSSGQV